MFSVRNNEKNSVPKSYESEQSYPFPVLLLGIWSSSSFLITLLRLSLEGNSGKAREEIKDSLEINQHFFGKGQMTQKHLATFDESKLSEWENRGQSDLKIMKILYSVLVYLLSARNKWIFRDNFCQSCICLWSWVPETQILRKTYCRSWLLKIISICSAWRC